MYNITWLSSWWLTKTIDECRFLNYLACQNILKDMELFIAHGSPDASFWSDHCVCVCRWEVFI
jgi:hypothetical protein